MWVNRNVVASDVIPRQFPIELDRLFQILDESLKQVATGVGEIDDSITRALIFAIGGRHLNREQFHLISALGGLSYSNKSAGLSEYDDYEIFQHFCYESDNEHGYITPGRKALPPPVMIGQTTHISARVGPEWAPEDIPWDRLRSEQRVFFERYVPDVVARFKRET